MDYIDRSYTPDDEELVTDYYLKPSSLSAEETIENIAKESSIGTWTKVQTMSPEISERLKPHAFEIKKKGEGALTKIAYPQGLFEKGNMPQILSSIAGNIFGMKLLDDLRLLDIDFPENIIRSFKGPQMGLEGIRDLLDVRDRPLLGTIVKPKVGLTSEQHSDVAYRAWKGGLDIVKDDENLSSLSFNPFKRRIKKTLKARDRAEKETGERKEYMPNITAPLSEMERRADFAIENGSNYVMIDIITTGWSAFQEMRDYLEGKNVAIHCHRAGHAAFTRKENHGISMLTVAKITRLIGGDQLHTGTVIGKMEGEKEEIVKIDDFLRGNWHGRNRTFPVASGGLHPGSIPELVDILGDDMVAQFGGGCHGHPGGTVSGARAIRQATEAAMGGIGLEEYAEDHAELSRALDKWRT